MKQLKQNHELMLFGLTAIVAIITLLGLSKSDMIVGMQVAPTEPCFVNCHNQNDACKEQIHMSLKQCTGTKEECFQLLDQNERRCSSQINGCLQGCAGTGGCPRGTFASTAGCISCPPGEYPDRSGVCQTTCAPGFRIAVGLGGARMCVPIDCPLGQTRYTIEGACEPIRTCQQGYTLSGEGVCIGPPILTEGPQCAPGSYLHPSGLCVPDKCQMGELRDSASGLCRGPGTCLPNEHPDAQGICRRSLESASCGSGISRCPNGECPDAEGRCD